MATAENPLTLFALTQQTAPEYWHWEPAEHQHLTDTRSLLTHLVHRLEVGGCKVAAAYGIIHDKDQQEVWDQLAGQLVTQPKAEHIHAVIKFKDRASGALLYDVARLLGVEPQYVEKPGRGGYALDNMLSYLTHAKYPDKYQYPPAEVVTVRGDDYQGIDAARRESWLKGRAHITKKRAAEGLEDLRDKALKGEITREQIMLTDELFEIYGRHQREIDDALRAFGERRAIRAAAKLRAGDFRTHVIFVHGPSKAGKTEFAKGLIAEAIQEAEQKGEKWSLYRAASRNALDEWAGEEVLLLDDLRASAMGASDWLTLLDPNNATPASARYKNKPAIAPRLIVLTATIDPVEYFFETRRRSAVDEPLDQFIRRLASIVEVRRVPGAEELRTYIVGRVAELPSYRHRVRRSAEVVPMSFGVAPRQQITCLDQSGAVALTMQDLRWSSADVMQEEFDEEDITEGEIIED